MEFIDEKLMHYCLEHTTAESELLYKINRETHLEVLQPRMLSGNLQGRFLSLISKLLQPKSILELGTYTGYSALCLAEGLSQDGKLITIDKNPELEKRVRAYFNSSPFSNQIEMIIGNAMEILPKLVHNFDLIFIDADKENYLNYLKILEPKLKAGNVIIADNVLWSGKVIETLNPKDTDTKALLEFNAYIQHSTLYENLLLPVRDGLMILRVK
jgi:predicted O-methyltransferase YrrM